MKRRFVRIVVAGLLFIPPLAAGQSGELEEIIVTGSYIRGSAEDAPSPVQSLQRESIVASGASDMAEVMRNLEIASGSDTAPSDGTRFNGGAGGGLANVNLRGLGPTATLVLLDGKRLPFAGQKLSDGDRFVDINSIPVTMIQRVEVLKNGASATYGSDAIAGVVNFITRSDFEGFELTGKWQSTTEGSQEDATLGAIFGWASDDGKSNFVIGGEYFDRSLLRSSERPDLRRDLYERQDASIVNRFTFTGGDPLCETAGFFRDNGESSDPFLCARNGSETDVMIPKQKRGSVLADFRYGFSDSVEFYAQGSYMEGRSGQNFEVYAGPIEPKFFLPALLGLTSGAPQPDFGYPNDPSLINNGGPLPPPAFTPPGLLPLELADYTLRVPGIEADRRYDSHNETQNWRVSAGLRGDFDLGDKAWNYDFSVTHGENNFRIDTLEIDKNRLELAMYGLGGPNCTPNGSIEFGDPRADAGRFLLAGADNQFDLSSTAPGAIGPLEPVFISLSGTLPGGPSINEDVLLTAMTSTNMGDASQGCSFFNPFLHRTADGGSGPNSEELLR
ncbi:MAG: TonB-dependent receptor plug domain-containing protein, partial [Pseudomonadota bacterium]